MADPLSIAAGVAGLVALAGTVSKTFYQFFASIHDAPASVRDLATALVTLNIALGQVQENLLNPRFVADADDEYIASLQRSLEGCTALFSEVQTKVDRSGLSANQISTVKKAWESVKWSFQEEEIASCLRRVETEKSTLLLVVDVFAARLTANILGQVAEVKALLQKQDRRLKNIHVFCQWVVSKDMTAPRRSHSDKDEIQTSAFAASAAYSEDDIGRLLQDSGSVLSLTLGDAADDSLGAVWAPDPASRVPLRRTISKLMPGNPKTDRRGHYVHADRVVALSTPGPVGSADILSAISSLTSVSITSNHSKRSPSSRFMDIYFKAVFESSSTLNMLGMQRDLFLKAATVSKDMTKDLTSFQTMYSIIEKYLGGEGADEALSGHVKGVQEGILAYVLFASNILNPEPGKSKTVQSLKAVAKADSNELERKSLRSAVFTEYEALKQAHAFEMAKQAAEMQKKQLELQQQLATDMQLLLERATTSSEVNRSEQLPVEAGQRREADSTSTSSANDHLSR